MLHNYLLFFVFLPYTLYHASYGVLARQPLRGVSGCACSNIDDEMMILTVRFLD